MELKLIVTHMNPDLDAVAGVWVLKRFDEQHFGGARLAFVPAGERISTEELDRLGVDKTRVVHVDTGLGEFDHHTEKLAKAQVSAASLVRDHVMEIHPELASDEALARMTDYIVEIDHFGEFFWPEPNSDRHLFGLVEILHHLKTIGESDEGVVEFGIKALDSIYSAFKVRLAAREELERATKFETRWGKGLGVETANDEVLKYAQKEGYKLVVRRDPEKGNVRIKAAPGEKIDLTDIYEKIIKIDSKATWFLHPAKTMLLNGSRKHQGQVPSRLSLEEVIDLFENSKT